VSGWPEEVDAAEFDHGVGHLSGVDHVGVLLEHAGDHPPFGASPGDGELGIEVTGELGGDGVEVGGDELDFFFWGEGEVEAGHEQTSSDLWVGHGRAR
jgi:hypothetical protein